MFGRIVYAQSKKVTFRREEQSGALFAVVSIPAGRTSSRHVRKAAKLLCRRGVSRVLAPSDFPHWDLLRSCGMAPVDTVPFVQAMAPALVLAALRREETPPEKAAVVLMGARASRPMRDAAFALCPVLWQLVIEAPSGGEELAAFLRWEYGLALLERWPQPRLAAAFSDSGLETRDLPVLRLYEPVDLLGLDLRAKSVPVPEDAEPRSFLAALWEMGRIGLEDVDAFPGEGT